MRVVGAASPVKRGGQGIQAAAVVAIVAVQVAADDQDGDRGGTRTVKRDGRTARAGAGRPRVVDEQDGLAVKLLPRDVLARVGDPGNRRCAGALQHGRVAVTGHGDKIAGDPSQRVIGVAFARAGGNGRHHGESVDAGSSSQTGLMLIQVTPQDSGQLALKGARSRSRRALVRGQRVVQLLAGDAVGDGRHGRDLRCGTRAVMTAGRPGGEIEADLAHAGARTRAEHEVAVRRTQLADRRHDGSSVHQRCGGETTL